MVARRGAVGEGTVKVNVLYLVCADGGGGGGLGGGGGRGGETSPPSSLCAVSLDRLSSHFPFYFSII